MSASRRCSPLVEIEADALGATDAEVEPVDAELYELYILRPSSMTRAGELLAARLVVASRRTCHDPSMSPPIVSPRWR